MQVILVYRQPFRRNSFLKCVAARQCKKINKTPYFGGSRSFVIDVNIPKKLVASVCYDKPNVCAYLQPFSR